MNCNKEAKSLTFGGVQKSAKTKLPNLRIDFKQAPPKPSRDESNVCTAKALR